MKGFVTCMIMIMMLSCLAVCAQNDDVGQYLESLALQGAKVSVARINEKGRLGRRVYVRFEDADVLAKGEKLDSVHRVPRMVDSICLYLERVALHAVEAYRYNKHSQGKDTIAYSLSIKAYGDNEDCMLEPEEYGDYYYDTMEDYFRRYHSSTYENSYRRFENELFSTLKGKNRRTYYGAKEFVIFDYVNGRGNIIYMENKENEFYKSYFGFHIDAFDELLDGLMTEAKAKRHSVEYVHGEVDGMDRSNAYYLTDGLYYGSNDSHTKGTLYVVESPEDARRIYDQLFRKAESHMDNELGQCCVMEYSNRSFSLCGIKNITKLVVNNLALSSYVVADMGNDGRLYVLRLEVEGEYWIPKDWKRVKSYVHGKEKKIRY